MKKEKLIWYRDEFWKQMIIESVGEDIFKKIDTHIKNRIYSSKNILEFAVFDLEQDDLMVHVSSSLVQKRNEIDGLRSYIKILDH